MGTLTISENNNAKLKKKLAEEEQARKSADSALNSVQRQAKDQRRRLHEATNELTAANEQMATLKKQLEEA